MDAKDAADAPVNLINSGPSMAPVAAKAYASEGEADKAAAPAESETIKSLEAQLADLNAEVKRLKDAAAQPLRRRLAETRMAVNHKFEIAGHEGYLTVGLFEDGQPGELFITMAKEGSTIGGLMDSLGTATSVALPRIAT